MENNYITYKRVKINWWVFILFGGIHLCIIYLYIHQFGTNPIDMKGLIRITTIFIFVYIFIGRFKVIIDDNFAIFRSDVWIPVKIQIPMIDKVSVKEASMMGMNIPFCNIPLFGNVKSYRFDFSASHAVKIQLINGKIYQIAIKDAEKIKEEIEKRMIKPLFYEK